MKFIEGLESYFEKHNIPEGTKVVGEDVDDVVFAMWGHPTIPNLINGVCLGPCCREGGTNVNEWDLNENIFEDDFRSFFVKNVTRGYRKQVKNKRRIE